MDKVLALMHDTSGKTNRIRVMVKGFREEINKFYPDFLDKKVPNNEHLTIGFYLRDIENMANQLDKVLDAYYTENKTK